jgi:hypothetical protein
MDTFADAVRGPRGNATPEGAEPGSLSWARCKIEEVKTKLRGDPRRAYSVEFTAAAEVLREHDPVEFNRSDGCSKTNWCAWASSIG